MNLGQVEDKDGFKLMHVQIVDSEQAEFDIKITSTALGTWNLSSAEEVFGAFNHIAKIIVAKHKPGQAFRKSYEFDSNFKSLNEAADWLLRANI